MISAAVLQLKDLRKRNTGTDTLNKNVLRFVGFLGFIGLLGFPGSVEFVGSLNE